MHKRPQLWLIASPYPHAAFSPFPTSPDRPCSPALTLHSTSRTANKDIMKYLTFGQEHQCIATGKLETCFESIENCFPYLW